MALYRGDSVSDAKLLALTAEPELVREFTSRLLSESEIEQDPILRELECGRRRALQLVRDENGA